MKQLKKCGFDHVLAEKEAKWGIEADVGIAYYYYIAESFHLATIEIEKLLERKNLEANMESELHNLLALCYRKSVGFGESKDHFKKAFEIGESATTFYDQSISLINLEKIAYHELDWAEADGYNKKAITYLRQELEASSDEDYKISLELFIAEYHRLSAESLIWDAQAERVNAELKAADVIYQEILSRDRYYIRYLYTSTFRDILVGKYKEAYDNCDLLFEQAMSAYDKSQIMFYRGIASMQLGYSDDVKESVTKAYEYAYSIGAWLELEEIIALASFAGCDVSHLKSPEIPKPDKSNTTFKIPSNLPNGTKLTKSNDTDHLFQYKASLPSGGVIDQMLVSTLYGRKEIMITGYDVANKSFTLKVYLDGRLKYYKRDPGFSYGDQQALVNEANKFYKAYGFK